MVTLQQALDSKKPEIIELLEKREYGMILDILDTTEQPFLPKSKEPYDRFSDVAPYNSEVSDFYGIKYVNASFVTVNGDSFIACQEPKNRFVDRFHTLVGRSNPICIISLKDEPSYISKDSCSSPIKGCEVVMLNELPFLKNQVLSIEENRVEVVTCLVWNDHSVLGSKEEMEFLHGYLQKYDQRLKIINCRAGVGRTGTFIMFRALKSVDVVNIDTFVDVLISMRKQRHLLVQSEEQLRFLAEYFLFSQPCC